MTSASTLIRKARLAESRGHRAAGKRLRADAAKLRRAARKKKAKPAKKKKAKKAATKVQRAIAAVAALAPSVGEQAKSPLDLAVERVLGTDATLEQSIALRRELLEARKTGENNAAARHASVQEAHDISTVCGFIAITEHSERLNGNLPPTMAVSGYMVAKLVQALRKAGYTRDGLNGSGTNREAIAARVSESRGGWRPATEEEILANRARN